MNTTDIIYVALRATPDHTIKELLHDQPQEIDSDARRYRLHHLTIPVGDTFGLAVYWSLEKIKADHDKTEAMLGGS